MIARCDDEDVAADRETPRDADGPGVLVLTGPPCAGKSEVARALAAEPNGDSRIFIEVDSLFLLLLPDSDRGRHDRMLAYDAAHVLARLLLERGYTPVLECTYARREQRASLLEALADLPSAPLWVVELSVTPDEAVERFRRRLQATDLDEESLRERVAGFQHSGQALQVPSSAPPPVLAHRVATWLLDRPASVSREAWAAAGRGWD